MRIKIQSKENNYKLVIFLPTSLIKTKIFWSFINNESIKEAYHLARITYKLLKNYIKENGHFTLVDIQSENGLIEIKV